LPYINRWVAAFNQTELTMQTAGSQIWPHLPSDKPAEPQPVRRERSPLAESMYPNLMPKPPAPTPRPKLTRAQIFKNFSETMDQKFAALVGFKLKT
jgi:hypothetical protein